MLLWCSPWTTGARLCKAALVSTLLCIFLFHFFYQEQHVYFNHHTVSISSGSNRQAQKLNSSAYYEVAQSKDEHIWPWRVFRSSPITPPNLTVAVNKGDLADGYIFLTPENRGPSIPGTQQTGPFIIGPDNEPVYHFDDARACNNFRVQEIGTEPHLTFWRGELGIGHGYGHLVILDSEYQLTQMSSMQQIQRLGPDAPTSSDVLDYHETQMTSRGTILMTAYNDTFADLSSIGGRKHTAVMDSLILEVDIETGETVFAWSALDHVPVSTSKFPLKTSPGSNAPGNGWDFFHINTIEDLPEGILVGSRHTWSFYLISRETGEIIWTLDGSGLEGGGSFAPLPADGLFQWQHHARIFHRTETSFHLSLFDNHWMRDVNTSEPSRGLLLELPSPPNKDTTPKVLAVLEGAEPVYADSQGSMQVLENGNALVSHGPVPVIREFGPWSSGGELLWEARFGLNDRAMSYRVYKSKWSGRPRFGGPSLVLEPASRGTHKIGFEFVRAYVSWNGATDVDEWNVYYTGLGRKTLGGWAQKRGFETVFDIEVPSHSPCIQVAAVEDKIEVRYSEVVCL